MRTIKRIQQPLKWHGGKHYLAARIIELMPEHDRYLEAFSGGLSVLLCKPFEGIAEYANDLNNELTNFWKVIQQPHCFECFKRIIDSTPLSEPAFNESSTVSAGANAIERAVAFFMRIRMSRQGLGKDYCTPTSRKRRGMNEQVSAWLSAVDGLPEVHQRLRRVEVWSRPAVEAIDKLDSESTLVYCDPPYLHSTRATTGEYGAFEMTSQQHRELLDCLASMRGRFVLSGYQSELYDNFAKRCGWQVHRFALPNHASAAKSKQRKIEVVWTNYETSK